MRVDHGYNNAALEQVKGPENSPPRYPIKEQYSEKEDCEKKTEGTPLTILRILA